MKKRFNKWFGVMMVGIIVILQTLSVSQEVSAATLIQNGNFETGNLTGWEVASSMTVGSQYAHSGSYGIGFTGTGNIRQVFATTAGQSYTVSGWVRIDRVTTKPTWGGARVLITDYGWTQLGQQSISTSTTGNWTAINFTFVAKSSQSRIEFSNFSNGTFNASGDDFNVASTSPAPAPTTTNMPTTMPTSTSTRIAPTNTPINPTPSPLPTSNPGVTSEWFQFGANAQHSAWLPQDISNWSFQCMATGLNTLPKSQIITGGGLYYLATTTSIVALNAQCAQVWSVAMIPAGTPAYDGGYIFAVSTSGQLYKLNALNGASVGTFATGASGGSAATIANDQVFFGAGNSAYAVSESLALVWQYNAGSPVVTPPAYSLNSKIIIVVTQDLYIHAINTTGARAWRVKPTIRNFGTMTQFNTTVALATSYPVIAEKHGLVFFHYQLDWNQTYYTYAADNAANRTALLNDPTRQGIFALNIADGSTAFVPAVPVGGGETGPSTNYLIDPANPPIIRTLPDETEVAFLVCRGRGDTLYDSRWDSSFCEMELDNTTVPGYNAGDVRYIAYQQPQNVPANQEFMITDEQPYLVGAGSMLLGAHWQAAQNLSITNRSNTLGSWANKIQSINLPSIVNIETPPTYAACTQDNTTHSCGNGLLFYAEGTSGRLYSPGFWTLWAGGAGSGSNVITVSGSNILYMYGGAVIILKGTASGINPVPTIPAPSATSTPIKTNTPIATATPMPTNTPIATPIKTNTPQPTYTATATPLKTNTPAPSSTPAPQGKTKVVSMNAPASVGKFIKYEATFSISRAFTDTSLLPYYPYADDPNGITIDVEMTTPSGKHSTFPAFYYQDFAFALNGNTETVTPVSTPVWKLRFAPQELGNYAYDIAITDASGVTRSSQYTFTSVATTSKGFVQISARDPRFMQFSDGTSFVPIARGRQWWQCCGLRVFDYQKTFDSWKQAGINFTRIWTQNDGYALTVEGHYDAYAYPGDFNPVDNGINISTLPKGTQINQRGAFELDKIVEAAERDGVYLEVSAHNDPEWIWPDTVYSGAADSPQRLAFWKRNLRYRAARWGFSTSIATFEFINEEGHIAPGSAAWNFYATLAPYYHSLDPNHLVTTSQGSQVDSPGFWSSSQTQMDMANYHDYLMSNRYAASLANDEANFVLQFAWCLRSNVNCGALGLGDGTVWTGGAKPWVWGEFDAGSTVWNQVNPLVATGDGRIRLLHNSLWAGLFTPLGTSPIDWYWSGEDAATTQAISADRQIASQFFSNIDYAGNQFAYGSTEGLGESVTSSNAQARVFSMRGSSGAYAWVQNKSYTYSNTPNLPAALATLVTLPNMSGTYTIQLLNTHTGAMTVLGTMTANGTLTVPINNLQTDQVIIAKR